MTPSPRDYTAAHAVVGQSLPGAGMPQERLARIAARRAFVDVKQSFLDTVATLDEQDPHTPWLRHQVRHAQLPEDLWLLRSAVFSALRHDPLNGASKRHALRRSLDSMFPGSFFMSGFASL